MFLLGGFLVSTAWVVSAEEVYVDAETGEYHKISCRLIRHRDDLKEIEKTDALKMGYLPDKKCYWEDVKMAAGQVGVK
jgi:hypothetical protein